MIELPNHIDDEINLVEFYIIKTGQTENVINVKTAENIIARVREKYANWKTSEYVAFYRNGLIYQYDKSNDAQTLYSKTIMKYSDTYNNVCAISHRVSKLPTYLFPCLNDIDERTEFTLHECKISNRISIVIRKDQYCTSVYIEYKHSPQAENEKNEDIIRNILNNICG